MITFIIRPTNFPHIGVVYQMEQNEEAVEQKESENNQTIEETKTSETVKDAASMETLLDEQGLGLDFPSQGEIRTGTIATIRENEVLVSIGTKSEGIISGREFEQIPAEERDLFEIGREIPVFVVAPEDQHGNVILSYNRAREAQDWVLVSELLESGESYKSVVVGFNKGGLIVPIGRLRGFVPASQVSVLRRMAFTGETPEERWGTLVDEPIEVSVIESDRERRRLILSERVALNETRESLKDRLLDDLEEGTVRKGRVTSLADFGAFVNIQGADGLVHMSEISWDRIQHPSEVLEIGQEVQVKVISVDRERKRIGLSIRQLQDDPWKEKIAHLKEGSLVEGTITHLAKFGAFAKIGEDLEGLIHVSEISEQRITHPKEVLHEGDVVTLRVIRIDPERRRIGLSLRKVDSPAYADLDWKMALADEVDRVQEEPVEAGAEQEQPEQILEPDEAEKALEEEEAEPQAEAEASIESAVEKVEEAEIELETEDALPVEDAGEVEVGETTPEAEIEVEDIGEPESGEESASEPKQEREPEEVEQPAEEPQEQVEAELTEQEPTEGLVEEQEVGQEPAEEERVPDQEVEEEEGSEIASDDQAGETEEGIDDAQEEGEVPEK